MWILILKLLVKIKHKTSLRLRLPLSLIGRGAGGEVHLLHLIMLTYLFARFFS